MPKFTKDCEKSKYPVGERSLFKPGNIAFLLCEILGGKSMTNEETKMAVDMLSAPKKPIEVNPPTQPTTVTTPQPTKKEVKPMAEVKDPEGKFDYTGCQQHVVQEGEKLFDVAQKYNVALQQLRYFNHINKATLRIRKGQTLYIPKEPVYVPTGE